MCFLRVAEGGGVGAGVVAEVVVVGVAVVDEERERREEGPLRRGKPRWRGESGEIRINAV